MMEGKRVFVALAACLMAFNLQAQAASWNDGDGGASRDYYNRAAKLPWDRKLGDWLDAEGKAWGKTPFATQLIKSQPAAGKVRFDVSSLVRRWKADGYDNEGFYLIGFKGKSSIKFYSRETPQPSYRPQLTITTNKSRYLLSPVADTYLNSSTNKSLGGQEIIALSSWAPSLLYFDLSTLQVNEAISSAFLELTVNKIYSPGLFEIAVYQVAPAPLTSEPVQVQKGVASAFRWDVGLNKDPSVYFATGFEERDWQKAWVNGGKMGEIKEEQSSSNYQPLSGKSLSATMLQGENMGLNQRFKFVQNGFPEPEEAYFRYYLRLGDSWDQTVTGGKMPGFAGTYNTAGWGSRKPDGTNGWSARGSFLKTINSGSDKVNPLGSYVYHLDQDGAYGSGWTWNKQNGALLKNNHWYCIEQYLKLNTPGKSDGVLTAWLDGKKIFERTGLQFRTTRSLKIEEVWLNIYHGGLAKSPRDQTAYIDNFVVAKKYIGPINE